MKRALHIEQRREGAGWTAAVLAEQDFQVSTADSGAAAIRLLSSTDFDLILLSLPARVKPGDRVIEWVASNRPHQTSRILVVSEATLPPATETLLDSLEIPVLLEPFTGGEFMQWVNAVLARPDGLTSSRPALASYEEMGTSQRRG